MILTGQGTVKVPKLIMFDPEKQYILTLNRNDFFYSVTSHFSKFVLGIVINSEANIFGIFKYT
jgi:hypothetical protein